MRWFIVTVCIGGLVAVGLGVLVLSRPIEGTFGGDLEAHGLETIVGQGGNHATLFFPGSEQELDEVQEYASATCADQTVGVLSAALGASPTPEAVARRYAEKTPLQTTKVRAAIYEGCLEGFGEGRSP